MSTSHHTREEGWTLGSLRKKKTGTQIIYVNGFRDGLNNKTLGQIRQVSKEIIYMQTY